MTTTAGNPSRNCTFCGTLMTPFLEARDYNRGVSEIRFHYHRCAPCGIVTLVDVPEDLGRYYSADYHEIPISFEQLEGRLEHERYKIELVRQFVKTGNLLEVGPSWGAFCLLAKRHGFSVEAIERDPQCREFLGSRVGIKTMPGESDMMALDQASTPDVIALWHAIEHLSDPLALLKRATARLAPGGILVIATPNPEALQFRLFGRYWAHLDAPRHINLIPAAALCRQARMLGLESLLCTTRDPGSLECNAFGWRKSLSNLVTKAPLKDRIYYFGRLVADVAGLVERREGMGSAYTVIFRKPGGARSST